MKCTARSNAIVGWLIALAMIAAATLAAQLRPDRKLADRLPPFEPAQAFPQKFGDWEPDPYAGIMLPAPDVQEKLDAIYNKVLTRVYVDRLHGQRVMLSVAYGGDQSDAMSVHLPEVCYPAQGFEILRRSPALLEVTQGSIPVVRLVTRQQARRENVIYWIAVGGQVARDRLDQKLIQLRFGLDRVIPDGMLVRVSNIADDTQQSFEMQDRFIGAMLAAMSEPDRRRVAGLP